MRKRSESGLAWKNWLWSLSAAELVQRGDSSLLCQMETVLTACARNVSFTSSEAGDKSWSSDPVPSVSSAATFAVLGRSRQKNFEHLPPWFPASGSLLQTLDCSLRRAAKVDL